MHQRYELRCNYIYEKITDKLEKQELKTLIEQRPDELLSKCSTSYSDLLTTYAHHNNHGRPK